jgi:hypothetical protein
MPEVSKRVWPNVLAGAGYLITFCACLVGTGVTLVALGVALLVGRLRSAGSSRPGASR